MELLIDTGNRGKDSDYFALLRDRLDVMAKVLLEKVIASSWVIL
jgi:hypothetical protein